VTMVRLGDRADRSRRVLDDGLGLLRRPTSLIISPSGRSTVKLLVEALKPACLGTDVPVVPSNVRVAGVAGLSGLGPRSQSKAGSSQKSNCVANHLDCCRGIFIVPSGSG